MRKDMQRTILAALAVALGVVMASCTQGTPTTGTQDPSIPAVMDPISKTISLDPAQAEDEDSKAVDDYVYESLVGVSQGATTPWLAFSWTVAEDNLAYTFELRTDVLFSDGTPMNADVVVANFDRWYDPANPAHGTGAYKAWLDVFGGFKGEKDADGKPKSAFDGAEKTGDFTVVLHLNRPVDGLLEKLAGTGFSIAKANADGTGFLGTGAYSVGQRNDQHLVLVPNPNYTGSNPPIGDLEFPFKP